MASTSAWKIPARSDAAWYWVRVWAHVLLRGVRDQWGASVRRHLPVQRLIDAPILAEHRSPLWRDGRDEEFELIAGKIQNLRVARTAFDAVVVPAGSVLSFWRQLGRPTRSRGFVEGREVRAGCVVPTIAGGLCQLSNSLATCAASCGISLIERHGHTARLDNATSDVPAGFVDATVFWNYIDLRLSAPFDFRVEVELTSDELVVRLRGWNQLQAAAQATTSAKNLELITPLRSAQDASVLPVARGCLTCNESSCFRHRDRPAQAQIGRTAVLVNAWTPEFASYLENQAPTADWYMPWVRPSRQGSGAWRLPTSVSVTVALLASLQRTLLLRIRAGEGGGRQAAVMQGDLWLARAFAAQLKPLHTHLIVDQSLLVPLMQDGVLAGRSYDVLVHALPAAEVQRRLDNGLRHWPSADSLGDFRIGDTYCNAEMRGLLGARRLVTPHVDAARYLRNNGASSVTMLEWCRPKNIAIRLQSERNTRPTVVFPASALPRKGVLELAQSLRALGWQLIVLGTPSSDSLLWQGVDVSYVRYQDKSWLERADVVVLPAYVEHSPRALLVAVAHGIPVVATLACGLPEHICFTEVPVGDVSALTQALQRVMESRRGATSHQPTSA